LYAVNPMSSKHRATSDNIVDVNNAEGDVDHVGPRGGCKTLALERDRSLPMSYREFGIADVVEIAIEGGWWSST